MALNTIGPYQFAVIQGVPGILTDAIEVIERPNVNGTALRGLGRHGMQFVARTIEDVPSIWDARYRLTAYETLVGADAVPLVINDVDYFSTEGILVSVLAVTPIRISKAGEIVGGISPGSQAVVYAAWQMKVIEV